MKNAQMLKQKVYDILNNNRCNDDNKDKATHLSYGKFWGKFILEKEQRKELMKCYSDAVENGVNDFSILETQKEYGPLIIDIDLEIPKEDYEEGRLYDNDMVLYIINEYNKSIQEFLNVSNIDYKACLLEKDSPTEKDTVYKDGFHVMFPDLVVETKIRHLIRDKVVKQCESDNIFESFSNTPDKIIDKAVVSSNGWFLYGGKKPNGNFYKLSKIYDNERLVCNTKPTLKSKDFNELNTFYNHENEEGENESDTSIINYLSIQSSRYSNKKSTPLSDNYIPLESINKSDSSKVKSDVIPSTKLNYELLEELDDEFHNGYENWRNMCFFMKNLNYPYEDFLRLSKGKTFTTEKACLSQWNSTRIKEGITEAYFYSRLKQTKPDVFETMKSNSKIKHNETKFIDETKIINVSQRYLIALENEKLDDETDVITSEIIQFFESPKKSLSIKSPYDTGKTKLLSKIFTKYDPKRILWLSYRKTLTNDILGSFRDEFNFKDYQQGEYTADRLIIQLESLLKLKPSMMFADDEYEIPKYDIIIIDEIESILSHFDSPTFKGKSREVFNWMREVIKVSSKMIVLDGDIDDRTYNFLNHFEDSTNIQNNILINQRHLKIITDTNFYYEKILKDILEGVKVVVCSMSSKKCIDIHNLIKSKCPSKKILIYTGQTNDRNKLDLLDVKTTWTSCDVLIYSPSIESGVNFDIEYFDKIYGVICMHSTCQRAFLQMLSRVRKIKNSDIFILNSNPNLKVNLITDDNKYYYDEIKDNLIALNIVKMNEVINDGKIKRELDLYDSNYIFNKIENLYKTDYYFLGYLKLLVERKGHKITFLENTKPKKIEINEDDNEPIDNDILTTPDINKREYEFLIQKQVDNWATAEDKLKIKRYVFKKCLGLDYLNCDELGRSIVKNYDFSTLKKYVGLISDKNIPFSNDNFYIEEVKKVEVIKSMIENLGFKNMYDRTTKINSDEFKNRISLLDVFDDDGSECNSKPLFPAKAGKDKAMRILFKTRSIKNKFDSLKSFLGCVNSILEPYSLKINSYDTRKGKERLNMYKLSHVKGRENIDELLQYRINKGFSINTDIRHFTNNNYYAELIKIKEIEMVADGEDETIYKIEFD